MDKKKWIDIFSKEEISKDVQQAHEKMLNTANHQLNANQNHSEISHFSEWLSP